jgi:hypothetical protein
MYAFSPLSTSSRLTVHEQMKGSHKFTAGLKGADVWQNPTFIQKISRLEFALGTDSVL